MRNLSVSRLFPVVLLLVFAHQLAWAQLFPGRITGTVRDSQGAAVAGANVKLTTPATGQERTLVSDAEGNFNFPELPLGKFQLTVGKEGFQTTVINDICVQELDVMSDDPWALDIPADLITHYKQLVKRQPFFMSERTSSTR